ncbi:hypothetical protein ACPRNU_21460 [Chromobacterium vaccinii]|uniref:hypothetical protein n=1 Tax=Chromobacterium vaccinii TaxID=1108595 RepID=UPI003C7911EF
MAKVLFTRDDVLKINKQVQDQGSCDSKSSLSSTGQKIVRESSFSKNDISSAFKEARRQLADKK